MSLFTWTGIILGNCALLYQVLVLLALFIWRQRNLQPPPILPPVSILKPLCGLEPCLYENLRSFCQQDYPCFEIIFGLHSVDDPALAIAHRLQSEFQNLDIRIVIQQGKDCVNRKVGNLANIQRHASFDYFVISDSRTSVGSDYLRHLAAGLNGEHAGVVTCLYRACPQDSFFSRLAALYMNTSFIPSVMVGWMLGMRDFGFGSTLALPASALKAIGGFAALENHLADDYMLARLLRQQGLQTVISPYMVNSVVHESSLTSLWLHEMRWVRAVRILQPTGHAFSCVTHSLPVTLIAWGLAHAAAFSWIMPCTALLLRLATVFCGRRWLQNMAHRADTFLLPLCDIFSFIVWIGSYFGHYIHWRGHRFTLHPNGRIQDVERIA